MSEIDKKEKIKTPIKKKKEPKESPSKKLLPNLSVSSIKLPTVEAMAKKEPPKIPEKEMKTSGTDPIPAELKATVV